jgi:hypothetical protein
MVKDYNCKFPLLANKTNGKSYTEKLIINGNQAIAFSIKLLRKCIFSLSMSLNSVS